MQRNQSHFPSEKIDMDEGLLRNRMQRYQFHFPGRKIDMDERINEESCTMKSVSHISLCRRCFRSLKITELDSVDD